jgi:hypothetical protein
MPDSLLLKLPPWLITPAAILALFLLAWPILREIWTEMIPSHRAYAREKRRLEVLKLYYEIQAIKKDHQLGDTPPPSLGQLEPFTRTPSDVDKTDKLDAYEIKPINHISILRKFSYGSLGGVSVFFISLLVTWPTTLEIWERLTPIVLIALATRGLFLALIGGFTAWITNAKTEVDYVMRGALVPLLIALLLSSVASNLSRQASIDLPIYSLYMRHFPDPYRSLL